MSCLRPGRHTDLEKGLFCASVDKDDTSLSGCPSGCGLPPVLCTRHRGLPQAPLGRACTHVVPTAMLWGRQAPSSVPTPLPSARHICVPRGFLQRKGPPRGSGSCRPRPSCACPAPRGGGCTAGLTLHRGLQRPFPAGSCPHATNRTHSAPRWPSCLHDAVAAAQVFLRPFPAGDRLGLRIKGAGLMGGWWDTPSHQQSPGEQRRSLSFPTPRSGQ